MANEVAEQLLLRLDEMMQSASMGYDLNTADLDELSVLHRYCRDSFSANFNSIFGEIPHANPGSRGLNWIERLIRIQQVEDSIPDHIRKLHDVQNKESSALIPVFALDQEDKKRISELCEKMRKIIFVTGDFDEPHRLRLLNRIAAIEAEIHKPEGMFAISATVFVATCFN